MFLGIPLLLSHSGYLVCDSWSPCGGRLSPVPGSYIAHAIPEGRMKSYKKRFPFKIGTTSYILPVKEESVVSNVSFLKDSFDMVQLLFFGREYLEEVMSRRIILDLGAIRNNTGLSYTVHLPSDLELLSASERSLGSSIDVIERICTETAPLGIEGYVLHVDRLERGIPSVGLDAAHAELFQRAIGAITDRLGPDAAANIYIENTTYDLVYFSRTILRNPCRVCCDAGHLMLHHHDLRRFVEIYGGKIAQAHLHGVDAGRDHQALTGADEIFSGGVARFLRKFSGSVIIEVYNLHDLVKSMEYIERIMEI